VRARHRHRHQGAIRAGIQGARLRGGLCRGERRLRAPLPDGARRPVGPRQGLRHFRSRGPLARTTDE
jgi:hypothetical protein